MCVIFTVLRPSPHIKFALAMNRDESFLRETASLQYWSDTEIYCGKDLVKGGSWLAINKKGWLVAITNIQSNTPPTNSSSQSRGLIPFELLKQKEFNPQEWKNIIQAFDCENFNVLFTDLNQLKLYVYSSKSRELSLIPEDQRIFSLANGDTNSNWFKQSRGAELISNSIEKDDGILDESALFKVLADNNTIPGSDPLDYTKWPIFVNPKMSRGTISSSIIIFTNDNEIKFIERTWNEDNNQEIKFENKISFSII